MDVRSAALLCDRARAWAAIAPDRELAELERKLLDRHLTSCGSCRAFAVEVAVVTELIRRDELAPLPRPIPVPSWRRHSTIPRRAGSLAAAAAVAVMAVGIGSRAPLPADPKAERLPRVTDFANNAPREVAQIETLRKVYPTPDNVLRLRPFKRLRVLPA